MYWPLPNLDATPLDTDWDDVYDLWEDMKRFAEENPNHTFIPADDPGLNHNPPRVPRLGWVAFINHVEDAQSREWTIPLYKVRNTLLRKYGNVSDILHQALQTAGGRIGLCRTLNNKD